MKQRLITVGVIIGVIVLFAFSGDIKEKLDKLFDNSFTTEKAEVIEVMEELPAWQTDKEAIEAAQAVIDRKNTEAELKSLEASFEASTAIYEAEEVDYKAKKIELEKKLGTY